MSFLLIAHIGIGPGDDNEGIKATPQFVCVNLDHVVSVAPSSDNRFRPSLDVTAIRMSDGCVYSVLNSVEDMSKYLDHVKVGPPDRESV